MAQQIIPKVGGVRNRDWRVLCNIFKVINEENKNENILSAIGKGREKSELSSHPSQTGIDKDCLKGKINYS